MNPEDIAQAYNQIAHFWESEKFNRLNGIDQHKRAINFVKTRGAALDVGCGSSGRFIDLFSAEGFTPEGVDISEAMLERAQARHPTVAFYQEDICQWILPRQYDVISAWDSIWHVPLVQQRPVLSKLIEGLNPQGVLIFSFGGTQEEGEHQDATMGPQVYYSSLGVTGFITLVNSLGCICRHLEFDQYPELHAFIIVQKIELDSGI